MQMIRRRYGQGCRLADTQSFLIWVWAPISLQARTEFATRKFCLIALLYRPSTTEIPLGYWSMFSRNTDAQFTQNINLHPWQWGLLQWSCNPTIKSQATSRRLAKQAQLKIQFPWIQTQLIHNDENHRPKSWLGLLKCIHVHSTLCLGLLFVK